MAHPHTVGQTRERQREGRGSEAYNKPRIPHTGDNQTVSILKYQSTIMLVKRRMKPPQREKEKAAEEKKVKEK